jgi:hypothetical protein
MTSSVLGVGTLWLLYWRHAHEEAGEDVAHRILG